MIGFVMLLLAGSANPPPTDPAIVSNPSLDVKASGEDMQKEYPAAALAKGLGGHVVIDCKVQIDETLTGCTIASETPADAGFGAATLQIVSLFRMHPKTVDGKPVADGEVRIPISWNAPKVDLIQKPAWIKTPSGDDFVRYYPRHALDREIDGHAVIACDVTSKGTLAGCEVTSETPEGQGFGAATLSLASKFRMRPATPDGKPVTGARVIIPITWKVRG